MTVIMGYKTPDKIYLGADNRTVTLVNDFVRDDANKIVIINNNVAVAFAGYHKTQVIFERMIDRLTSDREFYVEDALQYIKRIYWFYKLFWYKKFAKEGLSLSSRFIVAGKNKKGEYCIYVTSILHGKLEKPSLTDRFIFPPHDADAKMCCDIYAINTVNYQSAFMKRTVKDIAKLSKFVSTSGDIWTYDMITGTSTSEHFS